MSLLVKLARDIDTEKPCCENVAVIHPGKGPHAAEMRCNGCGRHRGWLPAEALSFITAVTQRFGAPAEPIILRQAMIGDHEMEKKTFDNTNSGALFRNDDKQKDNDRDYSGTLNVEGREFWISGWVKTSKKGQKFLSLSLKSKTEAPSTRHEGENGVPF
jgi:hypothetical protein